jgi:hypothetical protein
MMGRLFTNRKTIEKGREQNQRTGLGDIYRPPKVELWKAFEIKIQKRINKTDETNTSRGDTSNPIV